MLAELFVITQGSAHLEGHRMLGKVREFCLQSGKITCHPRCAETVVTCFQLWLM